jgi:hypothetical protein
LRWDIEMSFENYKKKGGINTYCSMNVIRPPVHEIKAFKNSIKERPFFVGNVAQQFNELASCLLLKLIIQHL